MIFRAQSCGGMGAIRIGQRAGPVLRRRLRPSLRQRAKAHRFRRALHLIWGRNAIPAAYGCAEPIVWSNLTVFNNQCKYRAIV